MLIVVSKMIKMCDSPGKHHITEVAKKIVAKYPESLQDVTEGDIIDVDYYYFVKQARIKNVRRSTTPKFGMVLMRRILNKFHLKKKRRKSCSSRHI